MSTSFLSNIGLKLAALVLAVTAYTYVGTELRESPGTLPSVLVKDYVAKSVPVHVDFLGKPLKGFEVDKDQIIVEPKKVMLIGPGHLLDQIDYLETQPIYVGRRSSAVKVRVGLKITKAIRGLDQQIVSVVIPIEKMENK